MRMSYNMYTIIWCAVLGTYVDYHMNVWWNDCEHEKPSETLKFHGHDSLKREAMIPENPVLADDLIIK